MKKRMVLETKRLLLREMNPNVYQALLLVFGDPETMWHYPYTFDGQHIRDWIERNMNRYQKDGFGLWAICLKEIVELIGDCGLTLQNIHGEILPGIGHHHYLETGHFILTKKEFKEVVSAEDRRVLELAGLPDGFDFDQTFSALFAWCQSAFLRVEQLAKKEYSIRILAEDETDTALALAWKVITEV